jgi:penicillin-binding protein 2
MIAFLCVMYGLLAVLFLRLWFFQIVKAPALVERANATKSIPVQKLAPRGLIYDRNNHLIASIRREIVIYAVPSVVKKNPWVVDKVMTVLNANPVKIKSKLKEAERRPYVTSPIFVGATIEAGTKIAESPDQFPGISVDTLPMRSYEDSKSFAHVLGYVWLPNRRDEKRIKDMGLTPAQYVGKQGVEKAYESDLMGQPSEDRLEVDVKGRPVRLIGRDEATPGRKLVLTLDADLQKYATTVMAQHNAVGGVVAIEPSTGEILCLVSSPTFDAQLFQGGITDQEWQALNQDPNKPMLNRAIYSSYPPGSTFKIITSLAAYETGKFDPNMTVYCNGGYTLNKKFFRCEGHHGEIDYHHAFEKSCNTYFATLGHMVGEDAIRKAALEMGLGERTGIEIGGEGHGVVPTENWLTHRKHPLHWYGGDTINMSIGQGYVQATPIQMCDVAAMVANNGVCYRPHLVREIVDPLDASKTKFITPEIAHQVSVSTDFWTQLKSAMVDVVQGGTAMSARLDGITWGGKTGSAENGLKSLNLKTHAWFVGVAPMDQPKICICVLAENSGQGGDVAAPVAADIVHHYLVTEAKAAEKASKASLASASDLRSPDASAAR